MKKLRIGIDIDDVLVHSADAWIVLNNKIYGTNIDRRHIYNLVDVEPWALEEGKTIGDRIHELMVLPEWHNLNTPFEGAFEVVSGLKEKGYELFAVTGRPTFLRGDTVKLLDAYFPGVFSNETLYMMDHFGMDGSPAKKLTKLDIAKELKLTHFVEDFLVHADLLSESGIKTVLFSDNYHWNKTGGHSDLVRLSSWKEIGKFFEDERRG